MQIVIVDNSLIYFEGIAPNVENLLLKNFSVKHPRARFLDNSVWDGWYKKYNRSSQTMSKAFLKEACEVLDQAGVPYDILDARDKPKIVPNESLVVPDLLPGITLEDYQIEALKAMCRNEIGIISSTTGSGKTEAMAGITKILDTNTVIFADIRIVIEQIKERLELRDVDDGDIGLFYAGQRPNGNKVVVGSIQSLYTPSKPSPEKYKNKDGVYDQEKYEKALSVYKTRLKGAKEFQKIVSEAELLLVDECDKASSDAYKDLFFKHFRGRYRYGFSGTPHDHKKPVEWLFLRERLGSIIYHIDRSSVEKTGRIIPIKPVMLAFGEDGDKTDKTAYDIAEKDYVINNEKFHDFVVSVVQSFEKEKTLIIVDTHEIASLGAALEAKIPNSKFIYGVTSKNQRNSAIKSFESGELRCLIGGKIIKRGLDLKGGADNVIFIGGGTKWSNIDQIVGRAVRKNARGWCRVFGFYIMCNHYLYSHSREQLKAIIDMGYDPIVVFSNGPISGRQLVKSRFKKKTT